MAAGGGFSIGALSWVNWLMFASAGVFAFMLGYALWTGTLITHEGVDISRRERPKAYWLTFVLYALLLVVTLFAAVRF